MASTTASTAATAEAAPSSVVGPCLSTLESLPAELLLLIVEHLPYTSLKRIQRVSKRLQAIVATPSSALDRNLWRTPYNARLLRGAAQRSEKNRTVPLQLHPILQNVSIKAYIDESLEDAIATTTPLTRCKSTLLEVSRFKEITRENATYPPIRNIVFDSHVSHPCICHLRVALDARCTSPCHRSGSDGGALTVKDFMEAFIESLKGTCAGYCGEGMHEVQIDEYFDGTAAFEGWEVQYLDVKAEVAYFDKPIWDAPALPEPQGGLGSDDFSDPGQDQT